MEEFNAKLVKNRLFVPIRVVGMDIDELYQSVFMEQYGFIVDNEGSIHLCVHFTRAQANTPSIIASPTQYFDFYFFEPLENGEYVVKDIEPKDGAIVTFVVDKTDLEFVYEQLLHQKAFCESFGQQWFEFVYYDVETDKPFIVVQPEFGQEYIFMTENGI